MNKTLTISIGGQLFEIEKNAYQQLDAYINSLKTYFKNDADGKEIVDDIEARIAELFIEQQTDNYKLIIIEQVEYVQMKMGTVKDFEPIEEMDDLVASASAKQQVTDSFDKLPKKLMRDNEDRVLGGVASGLGYYFNASPLLFRLLFLILFFTGPGVIVYLLFWIIVPKATTAADKLLMRGLPINVNTLAGNIKTRTYSNNKLIDFLGQLITYITKFAVVVAKLLLIVIGLTLLFALVLAFGGIFVGFIKGGAIISSLAVGSGLVFWFCKLMLLCFVAIPIIFIFVLMVYLLFNRNYFRANYVLPLAGFWLISALCVGLYGKTVAADFENENIVKQTTTLTHQKTDTLFVAVKESDRNITSNNFVINQDIFKYTKDSLHFKEVVLLLQPSTNNKLNLTVEKFAKGKTVVDAAERATLTNYNWHLNNDTLWLPNYLSIDKNSKWRKQEVDLLLAIPEGKVVHLANNTRNILTRKNENIQGIKGYKMNGRTWQMTNYGLDCLNCNDAYEKISQTDVDNENEKWDDPKFEAIEIEGVVKLNLKQGKHKIVVTDNEDLLNPFEYAVINGWSTLQVSTTSIDMGDEVPALDIWLPNLQQLLLAGASAINMANFELDKFELNAEGAHSITINNIEANQVILNTEGAGSYQLTGIASVFELNSEGLSSINAIKFKTENTILNIEGAATGKFWVTENLKTIIEGPAVIKYKGNPTVEKSLSMLGSLKQIR